VENGKLGAEASKEATLAKFGGDEQLAHEWRVENGRKSGENNCLSHCYLPTVCC
jgi:hypothetical protein